MWSQYFLIATEAQAASTRRKTVSTAFKPRLMPEVQRATVGATMSAIARMATTIDSPIRRQNQSRNEVLDI